MPQRPLSVYGAPSVARPIVMNEAWQARFNGLFNRTPIQTETPPSPPKTPPKAWGAALAVAVSSRAPMDTQTGGATVSLPQAQKPKSLYGFVVDDNNEPFSKPSIDFKEELSFGSLPKVHVPRNTKYNREPYGPQAKNLLSMSPNSKFQKPVISQTYDNQREPFFYQHQEGYFVRIFGTRLNNRLCRIPEHKRKLAPNGSGQTHGHGHGQRLGQGHAHVNANRKPGHAYPERLDERRPSGRINKDRETRGGKDSSGRQTPTAPAPAKEKEKEAPEVKKPSFAQIDRAVKEATGMSDDGRPRNRKQNNKPRGNRSIANIATNTASNSTASPAAAAATASSS